MTSNQAMGSRMRELATRLGFFLLWPVVAVCFIVVIAVLFVVAWPLIFTKIVPIKGFVK
jgi:hypothetical protein